MKEKLQSVHKQRGVALIIALVITTIALTLASAVVYRQQLHIRLTGNIANLEQAYQYSSGMEDWAGTILETDYQDNKEIDSLDEDWATLLPPIPIPGGNMNGQLYDLQARVNLNSLARKPPPEEPKKPTRQGGTSIEETNTKPKPDISKITRQRLINIIANIDPDQNMGPHENFADVTKDWIDADQTNGNLIEGDTNGSGSGAESPHYQSLEFPYYSASTLFVSPSELRLLKDMSDEVYKKLLPLVNTLPLPAKEEDLTLETPINVNTASTEVFEAIGFSKEAASNIISYRENKKNNDEQGSSKDTKQAFENMNEFLNQEDVKAATDSKPSLVSTDNLDVKSNFFLLQGLVKINNTRLFINSILYRKNGKVSVIMRDFSNPQTFTTSTSENSTL